MPQYYSTFPSGFEPAVEEFVARDMPGTEIMRLLDGAVEYRRRKPLTSYPSWFNNTFLCVMTFPGAAKDPLQDMVRLALQRGIDSELLSRHIPAGAATFRAMFMLEGLLTHAGMKTMAKVEEFLTINTGLTPGRAKPDVEFWFLYRREGMGFLLMRLTYHKDFARELPPGELRPDIANLLCRLSNPKPSDVFLDPFAGYGGIVKARLSQPAALVRAADVNLTPQLLAAVKGSANAEASKLDALDMKEITSGSVDAIVCNPPWDERADLADTAGLYGRFAAEARRLLKKDGRLVVLTALKKEADAALRQSFSLEQRLDVLVAGRKSAVFVCRNVR